MDIENLKLPESAYLIVQKEEARKENIKTGRFVCFLFIIFIIVLMITAYYLSKL